MSMLTSEGPPPLSNTEPSEGQAMSYPRHAHTTRHSPSLPPKDERVVAMGAMVGVAENCSLRCFCCLRLCESPDPCGNGLGSSPSPSAYLSPKFQDRFEIF